MSRESRAFGKLPDWFYYCLGAFTLGFALGVFCLPNKPELAAFPLVSQWHVSESYAPPEDSPILGYWDSRNTPGYPEVLTCRIINNFAYENAPSDRPVRLLFETLPDLWTNLP